MKVLTKNPPIHSIIEHLNPSIDKCGGIYKSLEDIKKRMPSCITKNNHSNPLQSILPALDPNYEHKD